MEVKKGIYKHYKGNLYEVIGMVKHSETLEDMVLYKPLYNEEETLWVRPVVMFAEIVEVNGERLNRFELINKTLI